MKKENTEQSALNENELPALLWDKMPENAESHPDYMAIQALMYDESTSLEQADNFKDQGNQRLKVGVKSNNKVYFHEAIKFYTKGLEVDLKENPTLRAILFSNRAQAELYLGNWRKAFTDSEAALRLDSQNLKALYRGARSALKLDEITAALLFCQSGLKIDPNNKDLRKLQMEVQKRENVIKSHEERATRESELLQQKALHLMNAFSKRNIRLCQSNFEVGKLKPTVDDDGVLHWPMLFVYPQTMQQDIIQDVSENDTLSEHLDIMFSPDAEPLQWDTKNEYRRDNIEVYYLANAGTPFTKDELKAILEGKYQGDPELHTLQLYGENAAYFCKVDALFTIAKILSEENCIIPGLPTFFIVAKGSNYHQKFLESITHD